MKKKLITRVQEIGGKTTPIIDSDIFVNQYAENFLMTIGCFDKILKDLTGSKVSITSIRDNELCIELETPPNLTPILPMLTRFFYHVNIDKVGTVQCFAYIDSLYTLEEKQ